MRDPIEVQLTSDRRVVACNYAVGTPAMAEGARCYVNDVAYDRSVPSRVRILARSRSGRWINKWEDVRRLRDFRIVTIPPDHPRYGDLRLSPIRLELLRPLLPTALAISEG